MTSRRARTTEKDVPVRMTIGAGAPGGAGGRGGGLSLGEQLIHVSERTVRDAHGEVRIMQPGRGDYFRYHDWDGRVCLINCGGSHHFATARYLAGVARQPVELNGPLKGYRLNPAAVTALTDEYMLFAITKDPVLWHELFESMRALQATYFTGDLPRPHAGGRVLLLPRRESRSLAAAKGLLRAGVPNLGDVLHQLLHRQTGIPGHDK